MKRFTAAAAALALTLALPCVPVFAADSTTPATPEADDSITVEQKAAGHTYEAYQIFAGSIDNEGKDDVVFSNLTWGDGIDTKAFPGKPVDPFSIPFTTDNAPQIAAELAKKNSQDTQDALDAARAFSPYLGTPSATTSTLEKDGNYVLNDLEPGYYLVTDTLDKEAADTAASAKILVPVDGQVTVTPKEDVPTLKKAVKVNDSSNYEITAKEDTLTWTNAADYSEGDVIDYKLTVTVPSSVEYYSSYEMSITDTIDPGLTVDQSSVVVTAMDADGKSANVTSAFNISVEPDTKTNGNILKITDDNIKGIKLNVDGKPHHLYDLGQPELVITYQATLNSNAVIAPEENTNTASLTYSDSPAKPDQTGTTKPVTVGVYTFEIDIEKTDANKNPLNGAGFTLYKNEAKNGPQADSKKVAVINHETSNTFSFKGLGSGDYKLEESTTPDGYNTMDPIKFTIQADYKGEDAMHVNLDHIKFIGLDGTQEKGKEGALNVTIANKSGTTLPKTGSSMLLVLLAAGVLILAYGFFEKRKESRK